jgi:predicted nucleic acid-binding protein
VIWLADTNVLLRWSDRDNPHHQECAGAVNTLIDVWQQVVTHYRAMGRQAHDARIAALMLAHGVTHILTLNPDDFRRYQGITVVTPRDILHQPGS